MPKKYCFVCGAPNTYEGGVVPKFCSKCGKSLTLVGPERNLKTTSKTETTYMGIEEIVERRVQEILAKQNKLDSSSTIDNEEEFFAGEIPKVSKKDCEIHIPKFLTIADLQNKSDPIVRESQQTNPDFSKE